MTFTPGITSWNSRPHCKRDQVFTVFKAKIITFSCGVDNECRCSIKTRRRYISVGWKSSIFYMKWYNVNYNLACKKLKTYIIIHRTAEKCKEV